MVLHTTAKYTYQWHYKLGLYNFWMFDLHNRKQTDVRFIDYSGRGSVMRKLKVYDKNDGKEKNTNNSAKNPFVFAYSTWHSSQDLLAFVNGIVYLMKLKYKKDEELLVSSHQFQIDSVVIHRESKNKMRDSCSNVSLSSYNYLQCLHNETNPR